jgi:excisionase family DNA binding protein
MLTISEAAKQTGLTRAGIHKAIKTGRLSATKDDSGNYLIDASELFRVYKLVDSTGTQDNVNQQETVDYRLMAQRLEFTERLLKQTENERDNLRLSLNQAMSLITHQPQPESHQPEQVVEPTKSRLFEKLFGRGWQ